MMRAAFLAIALILAANTAAGEAIDGAAVFSQNCAACHAATGSGRAPSLEGLRLLQPKFVTDTLESGAMRLQGMRLNPSEMRAVAEYVTAKPLVTEKFDADAGRCVAAKPMPPVAAGPHWMNWGDGLANRRFQPRAMAGMSAKDVSSLELKWAFGLPETSHAWSQPTVAGGRVFVGSQGGRVFALDAKTGCVRWSFLAAGPTRTAIVIGDRPGRRGSALAFFTTIPGWLYALDAETGDQVWKVRVEDHPSTRMTGLVSLTPRVLRGVERKNSVQRARRLWERW